MFIDNIVGTEILGAPISTHSCQKCWHIFLKILSLLRKKKWKLSFLSATKLVSSLTSVLFFTSVTSKQVHKTFAITEIGLNWELRLNLGYIIGIKFAPPYPCIFMDYVETEFLKTQAIKPWLWKRFIDDIFFIWTDSEKNLNKFLKDLNEFHPNLKFTYEKSKEKINFLDLVIKLKDGKIVTDLYCKPTDSHQYLYYDSCHAEHIKRSIFFSQTLRLKRICSQKSNLDSHVKELKNWFSKSGYPAKVISEQVNGALRSEEILKNRADSI